MCKIGVIHGRFQPFHIDHLKYVLAGIEKADFMYIGLTNPDPSHTLEDATDLKRSQLRANPCTFYERLLMVAQSLFDVGIDKERFCVVPFPINIPSLWHYYVPREATYFLTIYDEWGEKKLTSFQNAGLKTHVLWRRDASEKGFTGYEIRQSIFEGRPWEHFVPTATVRVMRQFDIAARIIRLYTDHQKISAQI